MRLLLDTHVLLWALAGPRAPADGARLIESPDNEVLFSAASIWEIAIKGSCCAPNSASTPHDHRGGARHRFDELAISAEHAAGVATCRCITRIRSIAC